jgi:hypothetical protein
MTENLANGSCLPAFFFRFRFQQGTDGLRQVRRHVGDKISSLFKGYDRGPQSSFLCFGVRVQ